MNMVVFLLSWSSVYRGFVMNVVPRDRVLPVGAGGLTHSEDEPLVKSLPQQLQNSSALGGVREEGLTGHTGKRLTRMRVLLLHTKNKHLSAVGVKFEATEVILLLGRSFRWFQQHHLMLTYVVYIG